MHLEMSEEEKNKMSEELMRDARYAQNSNSLDLVYETYGKAKMARRFHAITMIQFSQLNDVLVRGCINNAEWRRKAKR